MFSLSSSTFSTCTDLQGAFLCVYFCVYALIFFLFSGRSSIRKRGLQRLRTKDAR